MDYRWAFDSPVPADKARAWFFDVKENDHEAPEFVETWGRPDPRDKRTILSRTEDRVELEDVAMKGRMVMRNTVRLVGDDRVVVDGNGKAMSFTLETRFEPEGDGCHITMRGSSQAKGLMRLVMPLMKGKMQRMLTQDAELHVQQMAREWKEDPW